MFGEVGLVSGRDWRGRVIVGTCPAKMGYCRDMSGEVGFVSGLLRQGRVSVGTCSEKST